MTITRVLFCCLGNICRSPMCEAVFKNKVHQLGLDHDFFIDSVGTAGYHTGESPDPRTVMVCEAHQVPISHLAKQIKNQDFYEFDYILCMDESNLKDVLYFKSKLNPSQPIKAQILLFGMFDSPYEPKQHETKKVSIIQDPYYGGPEGFEVNFQQALRCSEGFLSFNCQ
ncbi:hypothetical protein HMI56_000583 [Coelomomyces lativittatus]|nr:hypothetical protein HMI56_000583 [Coelomomyces lativittatus]